MKESEKQYFQEVIFQAVQAGKQETSGLVDSIMHRVDHKIEESVSKNIEKFVNGHLRDIKVHLKNQDEDLIRVENKVDDLKKDTDPLVEGKKTITSLRGFVLWVATPLALLWGAIKILIK